MKTTHSGILNIKDLNFHKNTLLDDTHTAHTRYDTTRLFTVRRSPPADVGGGEEDDGGGEEDDGGGEEDDGVGEEDDDGGGAVLLPEHRVVSHLLGGCACRVSTGCRLAAVRPSPGLDLAAHLSTARLLFVARRRGRATGSRCPTVEDACAELLADTSWTDRAVDVAATAAADRYESYAAACALSEAALSCAAGGPSQARLADRLLLGPRAAVDVYARVLAADGRTWARRADGPSAAAAVAHCRGARSAAAPSPVRLDDAKTLFLDRLADRWPDVVTDALADPSTAGLSAVVRLWNAAFAALRSAGCRRPGPYHSQLPRLRPLLYRADTDPRLWLDVVRLYGAGLRCGRGTTAAAARDVADDFTRRRLLYFMGKTSGALERRADRERALQETVLLAMRSLRALAGHRPPDVAATAADVIDCVDSYVKSTDACAADVPFVRWLVRLTRDRDDAVVECLTCALDVADAAPAARPPLDPFAGFAEFLACVSYDPDVLLDLLIADENDFLPCALRMLKSACRHADRFFRACGDAVHDAMGLLIRLRLKMLRLHENRVFPYDVTPIARLIQRCDELYSDACPT